MEGIAIFWLRGDPLFEVVEQVRNALETADLGAGFGEREDALNVDRERVGRRVNIPVDESAGGLGSVGRLGLRVRRVEVGPINRDPEVLPVPDIDEGIVDAGGLPCVPEILVVVDFDHPTPGELLHFVSSTITYVPRRGIVGIHVLKLPEERFEPFNVRGRDGVGNDHVAPGGPLLPVLL